MMNRLILFGTLAFVLSSAVSAQTSTAFVRFRPAEAGFSGSFGQAASTFSDGKTRRWDFAWDRPLFATVPPVFGGVNVVNSATNESGSILRIHDNQPDGWPHAPLLHLFNHAGVTTDGVVTVNNVTMLFLWKKEHFPGFAASDVASFDANSTLSVNIPGWAQWTGHQPAEIRFLIRNGGQYYVSEARMPGSTGGVLTLTNFVLNPSNRWAPVTLTATSFQLPAILNFAPQAFGNVEAVGWIGQGSRAYGTNFSCASFDATGVRTTRSMAIGQNVNSVASFGTSHPFVDVMKMTTPWRTRSTVPNSPWDSERASQIPLDEFGWPTVIPFTASDNSTHTVHTSMVVQVAGSYRLRFKGQGDIRLKYNTETTRSVLRLVTTNRNLNTPESRQAGGSVGGIRFFDTEPINPLTDLHDFEVHIVRSDANDPIREIELITPGFANTDVQANPLLPDFVATLQGFRTLRMMDWNRTNNSPVVDWAGRTRPTDAFHSSPNGVALEYMILLCNAVGADMWICLPHRAGTDSDYVRKTARVLRHGAKSNGEPFDPAVDALSLRAWPPLNPSLKVMVEYSNETWNGNFSQNAFCLERAVAERAALPYSPVNDVARQQFVAVQSARIWGWFDEVFGNEARTRLIRVLASQSASPGAVSQPRLEAFHNPALVGATQTPDTLAIAPYFGGAMGADMFVKGTVATKTMESVFEDLRTEIHGPLKAVVGQQKALADAHGVWLTCYEAGQHLVGATWEQKNPENPPANLLTAKLLAANRDARMGTIYAEYLEMLAGQGIVETVNFEHISSYGIHGSWGILESLYQPRETAPKFAPVMNRVATSLAANHPPAIELSHPAEIVDTDGNGLERVTLSVAGSVDYEGRVTAYRWTLPGLTGSTATITPTLPLGRTQGTVMVTDDRGLASEGPFSVLVRPQGSDTPMLHSSFVSANATEFPGVVAGTTPWTKTSFLAPGLIFEGWRWFPRTTGDTRIWYGANVTNALGLIFYHHPATVPSTFGQAIAGDQYLSCTIRPAPGKKLDLRGAEVKWTLRNLSEHGARSTGLLTSVGGFTEAAAIHRVEGFAAGSIENPRTHTFTAQIPVQPEYQNITGAIELRIYLWGTMYAGHATHLTGFEMTGRVR